VTAPRTGLKVRLERGSPDSIFVSKLSDVKLSVAETMNEQARSDIKFRQLIEQTLAEGGRSNYIQICAPFELYALTRIKKPRHIVEVGVSAGVSSAYFLHALRSNGEEDDDVGVLHSIDLPEKQTARESAKMLRRGSWALPPNKETGWAVPRRLKRNWDLRIGRSSDVLPDLIKEIDRVDIFLYDVPYLIEQAKAEFDIVDQKLVSGSIALADNCLVPISYWAKKRGAKLIRRKNSGLRGFRIP